MMLKPGRMDTDIAQAVERARDGDRDAIEQVVRRAIDLALRTSAATLGTREGAADIAQDVAVDVLRDLRSLRDPSRFDPWVHRITVRRTLRYLRRHRGRVRMERDFGELQEHEQPTTSPEDNGELDRWSATPALRRALADLPRRQRIALALRYVAGLTDAEIAAALGCRRGTAGALLSRGRVALRDNPVLADFRPISCKEATDA
jgi:RNA polymerase sigma-70 factor, ECF subfamily